MTPPTHQLQDRLNFEEWFGTNLERLIAEPTAGFICAMVAFPLLERYLLRISNSEPKGTPFQNALLAFMRELQTVENAGKFWWIYRHGLLHNAELRRRGDWLSHEAKIVTINSDSFCLNPALFAQRVLDTIRAEFDSFAGKGLPQVTSVSVITPGGATTTYTGTGSHRP
jgi:hypothetical protein